MARSKSGKSLTRFVTVTDPDGNDATFGPDDELPGWAEAAITNPAAFESEDDFVDDSGVFVGAVRDAEHNRRGRVQRGVMAPTGMGERSVPENSQAAAPKDSAKTDSK